MPFALTPVLTRSLSPGEYGVIGMFQMCLMVIGPFTSLNVHAAASRKYFDQDADSELPTYLTTCVIITLCATLAALLVVAPNVDQLSLWTGIPPHWLFAIVLISGSSNLSQIRLGQWQARAESRHFGVFQISQSIVYLLLTLTLVAVLHRGLEGALMGYSAPIMAFGLVAITNLYLGGMMAPKINYDHLRDALSFGVPLIPHILGVSMLMVLDRFVIKHFLGLEQAGIYLLGFQLAMVLGVTADAFNKAYVPWLFEQLNKPTQAGLQKIVRGTYGYFAIATLAALTTALLAPCFVPWFAGEKYGEAGSVLAWLALGQAFNGMYLMVTNFIFYTRKTGKLAVLTLSSGSLHMLLSYLWVPIFGIEGAAISYAVTMAGRFLMTWYVANKEYPMPWFSLQRKN